MQQFELEHCDAVVKKKIKTPIFLANNTCMGGEKMEFSVLFKAQEVLAKENSIQFWLTLFKRETK